MSAVGKLELADRVAGALWGMLIADALAMPVHWFYGGGAQIRKAFVRRPHHRLPPASAARWRLP